jgi:alkaline phosphatase D
MRWVPASVAALVVAGCAVRETPSAMQAPAARSLPIPHGVAAGDVSDHGAILWSRSDRYAAMHALVEGGGQRQTVVTRVNDGHDDAGKIALGNLAPETEYRYTVWFSASDRPDEAPPSGALEGRFRTAPSPERAVPVTFGFSGDLGGLNACRDAREGYPIFRAIPAANLDFFIGLGDMIYADMGCDARGLYGNEQVPTPVREATTLSAYWAHWKYNRDDPGLRGLLAGTAYYGVWDDHEVMNDFGPHDDWHEFPPYVTGAHLLPLGRRALLDENPIAEDAAEPTRLYRSFRWGKELELVILDTRSYRDPNWAKDDPAHPKTMLGAAQRAWFERTITRSDATWKVVVSSVPISVPTGRGIPSSGHDGWANFDLDAGFEMELTGIFRTFRDANVKNLLFVTTDVHFSTGFVYHPFPGSPDFAVYEITAGPLSAMQLPTTKFDDTFHPERLFFFGPTEPPPSLAVATLYMNWAKIAIGNGGSLVATIIGGEGTERVRPVDRAAYADTGPAAPRTVNDAGSSPPGEPRRRSPRP